MLGSSENAPRERCNEKTKEEKNGESYEQLRKREEKEG
jgi:hypothetical protein